jgi:DNA polymerase I
MRNLRGRPLDDVNLASLGRISLSDAALLRAAANAPLQGSAADIMKLAMLAVHAQLRSAGMHSKILLQVCFSP